MESTKNIARLAGASLLVLAIGTASAQAGTLLGLTADNKLVMIDTGTMSASTPTAISDAGKVVGIDVRPADGKLYGLTENGQLVTIDHKSGKATPGKTLSEKVALGSRPIVDFNPAADRLRIIANDGVSLRVNVDDGATTVDKPLNYDAMDANKGKKPKVSAGAYTNSTKGTKATELFHVDAATGALVLQNPPNDGVLKTRGTLDIPGLADAAMDIDNEAEGKNTAWVLAGDTLYTVDLANGKSTKVGTIKGMNGKLLDVAIWK